MSHFRFDYEILYRGDFIRATQLPWHYVPVWISITTPPLYLLLFAVGTAATGRQLIASGRGLWRDEAGLQDLVFLAMFVVPIAAVILLQSVVYDGWRQLYFVYPAFLMVALRGWQALWGGADAIRTRRAALATVTAISLATTAVWMWQVHPLQNVYFNVFAGADRKSHFEMDYWGLATRGALEHVLARDPRPSIDVGQTNYVSLAGSIMLVAPEDRRRLRAMPEDKIPDYLFSNNRTFARDIDRYLVRYELFHEVKVDDEVMLSVYKRKAAAGGQ